MLSSKAEGGRETKNFLGGKNKSLLLLASVAVSHSQKVPARNYLTTDAEVRVCAACR